MTVQIRRPDADAVRAAAAHLRAGRLVVFPTETVYGLGANGLDGEAVRRIFAAKGRPSDNPVILHVADLATARRCADFAPEAEALARRFWPGPLTLVLPRRPEVPLAATGGLETVALRMPDHPVAAALLREAGLPIAAPSANRSGRPSATRVEDAVADLGDAVALYLDGGPARIGMESTIVGWRDGRPVLLRTGAVPAAVVEAVAGPLAQQPASSRPLAPGMKYRHYAPDAPLRVAAPEELPRLRRELAGRRVAWLVSRESGLSGPCITVVAGRGEPEAWAHRLYAALRDADRGSDLIVVEAIPEAGVGAAVLERLRKAAASAREGLGG